MPADCDLKLSRHFVRDHSRDAGLLPAGLDPELLRLFVLQRSREGDFGWYFHERMSWCPLIPRQKATPGMFPRGFSFVSLNFTTFSFYMVPYIFRVQSSSLPLSLRLAVAELTDDFLYSVHIVAKNPFCIIRNSLNFYRWLYAAKAGSRNHRKCHIKTGTCFPDFLDSR